MKYVHTYANVCVTVAFAFGTDVLALAHVEDRSFLRSSDRILSVYIGASQYGAH